tara:strand:+ start:978 stop:1418 length:441 start_codon:yes stop_codon:yes gene_type:complete
MKTKSVACAAAVIVTHDRRVLVGRRVTESGGFEWQLPGGWIEPGETPPGAASREVFEETGLECGKLHFVALTNNVFSSASHSISLYFEAECKDAEAVRLAEPGKSTQWEWRDWADITTNLYLPLKLLKETDYRPFFEDKRITQVSF